MALNDKAALKASILDWMARNDISGAADDFIALAEAKLNRQIPAVQTDVPLIGTQGSRRIDVSAHSVVEPIALFLADAGGDETLIEKKQDGTFGYLGSAGTPTIWSIDGTNIDFDCPLSQAFTFRFRIKQKFTLANNGATNWLLTNHPDVYLAASIVWGALYTEDDGRASKFVAVLREAIPEIKAEIGRNNAGTLSVDPALRYMASRC